MGLGDRKEIVIRVERELPGPDGLPRRISVSARYELGRGSETPSAEELGEKVRDLDRELSSALPLAGFPLPVPRSERELSELVETYRPRQAELVEALEADGEITPSEAAKLRAHLIALPTAPAAAVPRRAPSDVPITDRPLAAMPLANDRTPATPRPVAELLGQYRIESLKQAGAVRARRQISFEEYMALKRHFSPTERPESGANDAPPPT